jgi:hypothetical protein
MTKPADIVCQTKILVTYQGYRIDIRGLRWFQDKGASVNMQFKARQKWWHGFRDQNAGLVRDLESICTSEISGLHFSRFQTTVPGDPFVDDGSLRLLFLHDSRALNRDWRVGTDISPLLITPDEHHGNCFVEFHFNPGGYGRDEAKTVLRDDWLANIFNVSQAIEQEANLLLGVQ